MEFARIACPGSGLSYILVPLKCNVTTHAPEQFAETALYSETCDTLGPDKVS